MKRFIKVTRTARVINDDHLRDPASARQVVSISSSKQPGEIGLFLARIIARVSSVAY